MANPFEIEGAYKNTAAGGSDVFWYGGGNFAYADRTTALALTPSVKRQGLTVGYLVSGVVQEFWWPTSAIADADLIAKIPDLSAYATTSYVNAQTALKLSLTGGTMTGLLTLSGDPTSAMHAATKNYVDNAIAGLQFISKAADAGSTANVNISSAPASLDGITGVSGTSRWLLKDQTSGAENGVYLFNGTGNALTRTLDTDTGPELANKTIPVNSGTINADTWWTVTNDTITIGTTVITIVKTAGSGTYTNGSGILLTGNVFAIDSSYTATSGRTGYLSSTDWSAFNGKINLTSLSVSGPLTYNNTTGAFAIQAASATQDGYITQLTQVFAGNKTFNGNVTAASFVKSSGTSAQFLKADGSVDGNTYATTSSTNNFLAANTYNALTTYTGTITGSAGITKAVNFTPTLRVNQNNAKSIGLDLTGIIYDNLTGGSALITFTKNSGGSSYVNGTYNNVAISNVTGSGTGGTVNVVVSGGTVSTIVITSAAGVGSGYANGDTFTVSNTLIGGSGSGLLCTITLVGFLGTTNIGLLVNDILPSANNAGSIGANWTTFYAGVSATTVYNTSFRGITNGGYDFRTQSGNVLQFLAGTGNLMLNGGVTDTNWRLDATAGTGGSIRTTGNVQAASNIARGVYFNNSLEALDNNDISVGLDINNTYVNGSTAIQTLGTITGGSGYTNGTTLFTLTGGSPTVAATANITRAGGIVTAITLVTRGKGYAVANTLSATIPSGSGFSVPVASLGLTGTSYYSIRTSSDVLFNGYSIATGYKIPSGASTSFLKADGSVDNSTYLTSASLSPYFLKSGGTITGATTFTALPTISYASANLKINDTGSGYGSLTFSGAGTDMFSFNRSGGGQFQLTDLVNSINVWGYTYFSGGGDITFNTATLTANAILAKSIKTDGYNVSTLPTGSMGMKVYVLDALAPTYGSTVIGGGAVVVPVFYNGTNWIVD